MTPSTKKTGRSIWRVVALLVVVGLVIVSGAAIARAECHAAHIRRRARFYAAGISWLRRRIGQAADQVSGLARAGRVHQLLGQLVCAVP